MGSDLRIRAWSDRTGIAVVDVEGTSEAAIDTAYTGSHFQHAIRARYLWRLGCHRLSPVRQWHVVFILRQ